MKFPTFSLGRLRQFPTWLLLWHARFLDIALLVVSLAISLWLAVRFLLIEPPAPLVSQDSTVKQLSTQTLDQLQELIANRQREYEQPIISSPDVKIFYGGN